MVESLMQQATAHVQTGTTNGEQLACVVPLAPGEREALRALCDRRGESR